MPQNSDAQVAEQGGGVLLGRRAERQANPLAFYARLELGIADTLIARLSLLPELVVRPLDAVRAYAERSDEAAAVARATTEMSGSRRSSSARTSASVLPRIRASVWAKQLASSARW